MSSLPWFAFHIDDYLGNTMNLDTEGHGAYLLLILHYYRTGKPIRDNDRTLAAIAKLPIDRWQERRDDLATFFKVEGGMWTHERIEAEMQEASIRYAARSAHGKLAAAAKYGKKIAAAASGIPAAAHPASSGDTQPKKTTSRKPSASSRGAPGIPTASTVDAPGIHNNNNITTTLSSSSNARAREDDDDATEASKIGLSLIPPSPPPVEGPTPQALQEGAETASAPSLGAMIGTELPPDWVPNDVAIAQAHNVGMTDAAIDDELRAFHAFNAQNGTLSRDWTATWVLWCKRWKERAERAPRKAPPRIEVDTKFVPTEADWERQIRFFANTGKWSVGFGPEPGMLGCRAPRAMLEKAGVNPDTGIVRKAS